MSKQGDFLYNTRVMRSLNEDLKTGQFKQIYLLYGEENYLKKQYRDRFIKAMVPEGDTMNFARYEGKKTDIKEVIDLAETLPFFAERRVIVFEDTGFFKSGGGDLADYINSGMPSTTFFIFIESEVDRRSGLYKAVSKAGHIVELSVQDEATLRKWIQSLARKEKKEIASADAAYFINKVGTDMENITRELEKLFCYCMDQTVLTRADIDEVCITHITNRVYDMIRAMTLHDQRRALALYHDLLELKEKPMSILAKISMQYKDMYHIKALLRQGCRGKELADRLKLHRYAAEQREKLSARFTSEQLRSVMEEIADLEQRVKTGYISDELAVELFIVQHSQNEQA